LLAKHSDIYRFVSKVTEKLPLGGWRPSTLTQLLDEARRSWHGVKLHQPDWSDSSHSLAIGVEVRRAKLRLHVILNAYWEPLDFELPPVGNGKGGPWRRRIDTFLDSPDDIVDWQAAPIHRGATYRAEARSMVVLFSELALAPAPSPVTAP